MWKFEVGKRSWRRREGPKRTRQSYKVVAVVVDIEKNLIQVGLIDLRPRVYKFEAIE